MAKINWWQTPNLRTDEHRGEERKVTWLELFYDLVFVMCIAQLSHMLSSHLSLESLLKFLILFIPIWLTWVGSTFYTERFETHGVETRFFYLIKMMAITGMAIFVGNALDGGSMEFGIAYLFARAINIFMWSRAYYYIPEFRPPGTRFIIGYSLALLIFAYSLTVPEEQRLTLWLICFAIELITPWLTVNVQSNMPHFSTSKLPERFGLFVIIVLGESIVGVVNGVSEHPHLHTDILVKAAQGIGLGFSCWWIYFDFIARRFPRKGNMWATIVWAYSHFPVVMSVTAFGAGILLAINSDSPTLELPAFHLLCGATAVFFVFVGIIETTLEHPPHEPTHQHYSPSMKIISSLLLVGLLLIMPPLSGMGLMLLLQLFMLLHMGYGFWVWITRSVDSDEESGI